MQQTAKRITKQEIEAELREAVIEGDHRRYHAFVLDAHNNRYGTDEGKKIYSNRLLPFRVVQRFYDMKDHEALEEALLNASRILNTEFGRIHTTKEKSSHAYR